MPVKRKRKRKAPAPATNGAASTLVVDQVEMIDPTTLNEAEYNPREITAEALKRLQSIIEHHGFVNPIIVNRKNNTVIGGNQRLKAAIAMGIEKVPVVFVSEDDSGEKALNVALNAEYGVYEPQKMMSVLASLTPAGYDLNMTGFNPAQFKKLLGANWEKELMAQVNGTAPQAEEEVPEVPKKPKSKLGDLYELGDHRLLCGDATKAKDYEKLMAGEKAGMVFTDPPYGISILTDYQMGKRGARMADGKKFSPVIGNEKEYDPSHIFKLGIKKVLLWGANHYAHKLPHIGKWIIWDKREDKIPERTQADCELAWYSEYGASRIFRHYWDGMMKASERGESRVHPTQKPVALAEWCLEKLNTEQVILDPFGGSGSTLIACENLGRRCRMMELDPGYVDVIQERYFNATGKKAKKIR